MTACYLDTSALAKWYLAEPCSEEFEAFVQGLDEAVISRLTAVEMRCLLARRRRAGDFDAVFEREAFLRFERDAAAGYLRVHPVGEAAMVEALALIERLEDIALRTLDALHLAIALDAGAGQLATADRAMAEAGAVLGLSVRRFDLS